MNYLVCGLKVMLRQNPKYRNLHPVKWLGSLRRLTPVTKLNEHTILNHLNDHNDHNDLNQKIGKKLIQI